MSDIYQPRKKPKTHLAQVLYAARDVDLSILEAERTSATAMKSILLTVAACEHSDASKSGLRVKQATACRMVGLERKAYERNLNCLIEAGLLVRTRQMDDVSVIRVQVDVLEDTVNLQHHQAWMQSLVPQEEVQETIAERIQRLSGTSGTVSDAVTDAITDASSDASTGGNTDAYSDASPDGDADARTDTHSLVETRSVPLSACSEPHPFWSPEGSEWKCQECC